MGKFSGILLCADFDGTIAISASVVKRNTDAIRYFEENGGKFSVLTGRTADFLRERSNDILCNTYVGCVNGTVICDLESHQTVFEDFLEGNTAQKALEICKVMPQTVTEIIVFRKDDNVIVQAQENDVESNLKKAFGLPTHKFLIHGATAFTQQQFDQVKNIFGDEYEIARSWDRGIEGQNRGVNKASAARRIAQLSGAELLVCVGDYENDIPMIKEADIGYAVENAVDSLKAVADRITVRAEDGAIAAIIEDLEKTI